MRDMETSEKLKDGQFRTTHDLFTLVELLIVIAIMTILMTLLLPSLKKAKDMAYAIQCASTLKQFGICNVLYADVYRGYFIPNAYGWTGSGYSNAWYNATALANSVKTLFGVKEPLASQHNWLKSYICPKASYAISLKTSYGSMTLYPVMYSYGMNVENFFTWGANDYRGAKCSQIVNPSQKLDFADGLDWNLASCGSGYARYALKGESCESGYTVQPAYRHTMAVNALLYDGHVSKMNYRILQYNSSIWSLW